MDRNDPVALIGLPALAEGWARAAVASAGGRCVRMTRPAAGADASGLSAILVGAPVDPALIAEMRRTRPDVPVVACGGDRSQEAAMQAIRAGASDFLCVGRSDAAVARLEHYLRLPRAGALAGERGFVGTSQAVAGIKALVGRLSRSGSTTLIRGETGTGKELVALMLHRNSRRSAGPLVPINCAAIPETLIEGELFGYEKGAFSSAERAYPGKFRLADGGTLFLDEVAELSLAAQSKLLRALESGEVFPIGSDRPVHVDVRIVAATNRDLKAEIARGAFRADLFYRLAVIQLWIPPLRERREDIEPIARALLATLSEELGLTRPRLSAGLLEALRGHAWPGNVREMRNAIEHALVTAARADRLDAADLPDAIGRACDAADETVDPASPAPPGEREILLRALAMADGKKAKAARALNCSRMTLYRRLERAGVDGPMLARIG